MSDFSSKFKNASGAPYLKALFYETAFVTERQNVLYTLKTEDYEGYPSIQRLYRECDDPTEYQFAKLYFDGYAHFKKIADCTWFKPYLSDMRAELELKIKSKALQAIRESASTKEDRMNFSANRFLLSGEWIDKTDKRGRPSKEAIRREADKLFEAADDIKDDFGRVFTLAEAKN